MPPSIRIILLLQVASYSRFRPSGVSSKVLVRSSITGGQTDYPPSSPTPSPRLTIAPPSLPCPAIVFQQNPFVSPRPVCRIYRPRASTRSSSALGRPPLHHARQRPRLVLLPAAKGATTTPGALPLLRIATVLLATAAADTELTTPKATSSISIATTGTTAVSRWRCRRAASGVAEVGTRMAAVETAATEETAVRAATAAGGVAPLPCRYTPRSLPRALPLAGGESSGDGSAGEDADT